MGSLPHHPVIDYRGQTLLVIAAANGAHELGSDADKTRCGAVSDDKTMSGQSPSFVIQQSLAVLPDNLAYENKTLRPHNYHVNALHTSRLK